MRFGTDAAASGFQSPVHGARQPTTVPNTIAEYREAGLPGALVGCLHTWSLAGRSLQVEQELLAPQAAAVAAEFSAAGDDAVTRDQDGDAVEPVGAAHRTHRLRPA